MTPEELQENIRAMMQQFAGGNSEKKKLAMEIMNNALNLGAGFMDLGIAGSQIREGKRLREGIRKPDMFTPTRDRSLLSERIRSTRQGINDVSQDLAPAELANLDQYLKDIGNARIASGGQASIFGSMGNAASMRRRRGGLQIAALGSQIKQQRRGELNQLVGMDLADRSAYEGRKLTANELDLQRYYNETADAAGLEAAGRQNQRDSIYGLLPSVSQFGESVGDIKWGNMFGNRGRKRVEQINIPSGSSPAATMDVFRNQINLGGY